MRHCITIGLLLLAVNMSHAAVEMSQGGASGQCFDVVSDLRQNWIEVKRHLVPGTADTSKPERDDFVCVSSAQTANAMETRSTAAMGLRCFSNPVGRGLGFCCDEQLMSCAQLNPYLFPEQMNRRSSEKAYDSPKSQWVTPPSEGDQWKSN